ncbi:MAG: dihydropteroate synthase [Prevotella sp.]|nr:dihydropteroate synthase [Prevotella sp.]
MQYHDTIRVGGKLLDLSSPVVMGILNVTPDSFYAGSRQQTDDAVAHRAEEIVEQGGVIIDVGACSTRPGGEQPTAEEEMSRLRRGLSVVRHVCPDAILSIDTYRPEVAQMSIEEFGAAIINDVTGGVERDAEGVAAIFRVAARERVPYILTSVQPSIREVLLTFARDVAQLNALGVADVILDPGFGFGKTLEQNYEVLSRMGQLQVMGLPVLAGVSRKSMIYRALGITPDEALNGTTALHMTALRQGASILRVHDVREAVECCRLWKMIIESEVSE